MTDFTDTITDNILQEKLINALSRSKPFRNFKELIDHSDHREEWFSFKNQKYRDCVEMQLGDYNRNPEG